MTYLCARVAEVDAMGGPSSPETTTVKRCSVCGEDVYCEASSAALARVLNGGELVLVCGRCFNAEARVIVEDGR